MPTVRDKIKAWRDAKLEVNNPKLKTLLSGKERPQWVAQPGSQMVFLASPVYELLYHGTRGGGKDISLECPVLTDSGWKKAGEVTYQDKLVSIDGSYTNILGIYPKTDRKMRKVTFHDGAEVICDSEHNWYVLNQKTGYREGGFKIRTTDQIMNAKAPYSVPFLQGPIPGKKWKHSTDPYMVGLLLGDGTMCSDYVTLYTTDQETIDYGISLGWRKYRYKTNSIGQDCTRLVEPCSDNDNISYRSLLPRVKAPYKSIPKEVLEADPETRLAVLQGMMDSDGSVEESGKLTFWSTSKQLCEDLSYLVKSLGGMASVVVGKVPKESDPGNHVQYRVNLRHNNQFIPFRLSRKVKRVKVQKKFLTRGIKSIEPIENGSGVCFAVEHPSHLYVCGDFVITHNTDALLMDFLKHVGLGWGSEWKGILFRRTFPELEDVIRKSRKWFTILCPGAKYNKSKHEWVFPDGETLLFRFIEKEEDYDKYHGHNFSWMGWEELCTWATPDVYLKMMSCVRSTHSEVAKVARIRATANPMGPGHNWVKKRFRLGGKNNVRVIKEKNPYTGNTQVRAAIFSHVKENKILLEADPFYIDRLYTVAKGNKNYIDAWIHGSWDVTAGGMFDDIWDKDYHVVSNFEVPNDWTITISFDWGSTKPASVGWWAQSDGSDYVDIHGNVRSTVRGDLFRIAEWYIHDEDSEKTNEGLRLKSSEIAVGIIERELAMGIHGRVKGGWADPAIFASHDGDSIGTKMGKYHVLANGREYRGPQFVKADNARIIGWDAIRTWLWNALPKNGTEGVRENPGLFICERCKWAQHFLPTTQRDQKKTDDVDTDTEDHLQDEMRYRVKAAGSGMRVPGMVAGPTYQTSNKKGRSGGRVVIR